MLNVCLILDALILLAGAYSFATGSLPHTTPAILSAIFGFIGLNMLVGSVMSYQKTRTWLASTVRTSGQVIDHVGKESVDSFDRDRKRYDTVFYPIIRFQTPTGQTISFTSSVGSSTPDHSVGDSVNVLYTPSDPQRAELDEFFSLWLAPLVLGLIGIPMLIASVGLVILPGKV